MNTGITISMASLKFIALQWSPGASLSHRLLRSADELAAVTLVDVQDHLAVGLVVLHLNRAAGCELWRRELVPLLAVAPGVGDAEFLGGCHAVNTNRLRPCGQSRSAS